MNACSPAECVPFDNRGIRTDGDIPPSAAAPPRDDAPPAVDDSVRSCADPELALPNPVYITGGNVFLPVFGRIAQRFAEEVQPEGRARATIIFLPSTGCAGLATLIEAKPLEGVGIYWSSDSNLDPTLPSSQLKCRVPPGTLPDIATAAAFASSCGYELPEYIRDEHGPVDVNAFVVPHASTKRSISAEAARRVFGFGRDSAVPPWTDEAHIIQRGPRSGTQAVVAAVIGLPFDRFKGTHAALTADVVAIIKRANAAGVAVANQTLGFISHPHILPLNASADIRALAFQAQGQTCAFWPSSKENARDMLNVREGRYRLWGPYHFFTRVPLRPPVQPILNALKGLAIPGIDFIKLSADAGFVPQCAMKVTLSKDGGRLQPFRPPAPCNCYFDALVGASSPACKSCSSDLDCANTPGTHCVSYANGTRRFCER
jgi:hypothetical protein